MKLPSLALSLLLAAGANSASAAPPKPFLWENATVYFLVTDRFANGDKANDLAYGRKADAAPLRGFMGGDFKGLTAKIKSGYFDDLGVDVIWTTPPVEQIHAGTDEGTGKSYGFHGYWARDFTAMDANLGTEKDFRDFVEAAHARGIRVLLDVVMNHTGPVTETDPVWPEGWVRTEPQCQYKDVPSTVSCTLVKNLPVPDAAASKEVFLSVTTAPVPRAVVMDTVVAKSDAGKLLVQNVLASLKPNAKSVAPSFRLRVLLGEAPTLSVVPPLVCPPKGTSP